MFEPAKLPVVRRVLRRSTAIAASAVAICLATSSAAGASTTVTYYVDGSSLSGRCSDSHTATQAQRPATPWCTISKAVASISSPATIDVAAGTYHALVTLTAVDSGVTLRGTGSSLPVIDGDMVRSSGIYLADGVNNVTINGFEIENMTDSTSVDAAGILGYDTADDLIENNVIHDIHSGGRYSYGIELGNNSAPGITHDVTVRNNRIYDIGPGGESMGIWLLWTKEMQVDGNEIYLVRKEGIRDWDGLDNSFVGNRLYLNWDGLNLEGATGAYVANNVSYANVWGFTAKHVNGTATDWKPKPSPDWTRFWHNTTYKNTHADIGLALNSPDADYIDVRDNVFASPGDVHIHDFPEDRGSKIIVDSNVYSGSAPIYYATWDVPHTPTFTTLSVLQAGLGWETHGQMFAPSFANPAVGKLSFSTAGLRVGVTLPDAFGSQLGAVGVAPATNSWTRYPATVIASTPEPPFLARAAQRASDGADDTYWWSSNYDTNASITFDLSSPKSMNTFVLDLYSDSDPRIPKGYQIQVSNDNVNYRTVLSGNNPDDEGSSYKYTLSTPVTARYVRLNLLSNFGASTILLSDFGIGLLSPVSSTIRRTAFTQAQR